MPTQDDFPKSVVLHFPPSVYQKFGAAEVIRNLLPASLEDDALSPGSNSDILGSDEPPASGTASLEGDALSPGSNSDILGLNGMLLFRQSLKRKSSHIAQDIWDRVTEDLAYAVSKKSRAFFLEMSSSDLERFIVNASRKVVKNSSLFLLMLFSLTRFKEAFIMPDCKWNFYVLLNIFCN